MFSLKTKIMNILCSLFLFSMKIKKNNQNNQWLKDGIIVFVKVSSYITIPIVVASLVGNFLEKKYNNDLLFFILIGISFLITIYLIWREPISYREKYNKYEK